MKRVVYRGISFTEAENVVQYQRYDRNEPRDFQNGVQARSVFGPGIYLINDIELASQYAFCHAEVEEEGVAAVLRQDITLTNPFILNYNFTEGRLRKDALSWKYADGNFPDIKSNGNSVELIKWMGMIIKEYLLHYSYDGIIYHINDEIIYYVSYFPTEQITNIQFDFTFRIEELQENSAPSLRKTFKQQT